MTQEFGFILQFLVKTRNSFLVGVALDWPLSVGGNDKESERKLFLLPGHLFHFL